MSPVILDYATYIIYLTDPVEVATLQAQYPNGITGISPEAAAVIYNAPMGGQTPGGGWVPPGVMLPAVSAITYDSSVATGTLPDTAYQDAWGNNYPAVSYSWVGYFLAADGAAGDLAVPPPVPISQRRWIMGFELPYGGEGSTGNATLLVSRDASRTVDGLGLALRSTVSSLVTRTLVEYDASIDTNASWERFYVRPREAYPSATDRFWRCHGAAANAGIRLDLLPSGAIGVYNITSASVATLIGTTTRILSLDTWYRLDLLIAYNAAATLGQGTFTLYINGVQDLDLQVTPAQGGLGANNSRHRNSDIGNDGATSKGLCLDVDDWMNAEFPPALTGLDWLSGSHMQAVRANGFGASHSGNWAGNWRRLLPIAPVGSTLPALASSTSGARIAVTTDIDGVYQQQASQLGCAAMVVGIYSSRISANGTLGYSLAGGAAVLTTISQGAVAAFNSVLYRPAGMTTPAPLTPLELLHEKGASAGSSTVYMLEAVAEYLGGWGPEDVEASGVVYQPTGSGIHNSSYPNIGASQAGAGSPPPAVVYIKSGIYTGNNLGQDLLLAEPAHWLWVRPLAAAAGGGRWFSTMLTSHRGLQEGLVGDYMPQALVDPTDQPMLRVSGQDNQANVAAASYQWIAVCDVGMRFVLNGAFRHTVSASFINPLADPGYTPEAAFLAREILTASTTVKQWYKGIGHAATAASILNVAEASGVASFGLGSLTSQTPLHEAATAQMAYSLWRRVDCWGDTGVVQLISYIGDGSGNRVIPIDLWGRWPLFVLVVPHNAEGIFRDPSHTGTQSSLVSTMGITATTGIRAGGVDQITVGSALNTNGIVYDVFAIPGDSTTAWENAPGYYPVPPRSGCPGPWPPAPAPPTPPLPGPCLVGDPPAGGSLPGACAASSF